MARIIIRRSFGAAPNILLNNPEISFKAKGLYAYLNSKPEDWDFSIESIARQNKEGKDAIRSAIHELESFGYLARNKTKDQRGYFEIEYVLYSYPMEEDSDGEKADTGIPLQPYKKEYTKKEETKKENTRSVAGNSNKQLLEFSEYGEFAEMTEQWVEYKKDRKEKYASQNSLDIFVKILIKKSGNNPAVAQEMLEQSIANNWAGVFEIKTNGRPLAILNTGTHVNNPDFKLGAKRYRPCEDFATYIQYRQNCEKYGHTAKTEEEYNKEFHENNRF